MSTSKPSTGLHIKKHQARLQTLLSTPRHRDVHVGSLKMLGVPTQQQEADTATGDPSALVFASTTSVGTADTFRIRHFEMFTVGPPQLQSVPLQRLSQRNQLERILSNTIVHKSTCDDCSTIPAGRPNPAQCRLAYSVSHKRGMNSIHCQAQQRTLQATKSLLQA